MEENKTVDNIGNLVISEDVIAAIALNAAKDVEGVSSFAARTPDVHSILRFGEDAIKSVRVLPSDNGVKIYIHVNITPGSEIQKNVKNAVQSMTGKMVSKVNVSIAGIDIKPEGEK